MKFPVDASLQRRLLVNCTDLSLTEKGGYRIVGIYISSIEAIAAPPDLHMADQLSILYEYGHGLNSGPKQCEALPLYGTFTLKYSNCVGHDKSCNGHHANISSPPASIARMHFSIRLLHTQGSSDFHLTINSCRSATTATR